jgi:hypothetical protein
VLVVGACACAALGVTGGPPRIVRLTDSGQTIGLRVGSPAIIRLDHRCWRWSVSQISGRAATLEAIDYERDPGYDEWKIRPRLPGRTRISMKGNASGSCTARDRLFQLTVVVRAA